MISRNRTLTSTVSRPAPEGTGGVLPLYTLRRAQWSVVSGRWSVASKNNSILLAEAAAWRRLSEGLLPKHKRPEAECSGQW